MGPRRLFVLTSACALIWSSHAEAVDLPKVDGKPVTVDVTETSVLAQQFQAREGEIPRDQGFGNWLNKLNVALNWNHFTLGARVDSSYYWDKPADRSYPDTNSQNTAYVDGSSRFRTTLYPAKLWLTYQSRGIDVTVGDAYVQFGRGLTLSLRKIDELGVDTTLRGGKISIQKDPFAVTLIAGLMNPTRIDEASGRALFLPQMVQTQTLTVYPQPLFGSDRVIGAEVQAGRGLPVVLGTRIVRYTRCAPYHYLPTGQVDTGNFDSPLGSCDPNDTAAWLSSLPASISPTLQSSEILMGGESIEVPNLGGHGSIYVEAAGQAIQPLTVHSNNYQGNAVYGAFTANAGPVTNTLEIKSYRNFFPVQAAVDYSRAVEFTNLTYSNPPTTEPITQDSMFGFFNSCVNGGHDRADVRFSKAFLGYVAGGYYVSKNEVAGGGCDRTGASLSQNPTLSTDYVWDILTGYEWRFDHDRSYFFAWTGIRDDRTGDGVPYYQEGHVDYDLSITIKPPYSVELYGTHRQRFLSGENVRDGVHSFPWHEGQNYTAFKIAPKLVFAQGIEYTTQVGKPTYYFNGSVLYKFTGGSNIRVFVGQQRGGLKCVSGICKIFPPFEGARAELTLRF